MLINLLSRAAANCHIPDGSMAVTGRAVIAGVTWMF
ncbi:MAG: hypothetical protein ACI92Z_002538 [Paracoccaceae bacterium]|jgi:hypothetical protein